MTCHDERFQSTHIGSRWLLFLMFQTLVKLIYQYLLSIVIYFGRCLLLFRCFSEALSDYVCLCPML